MRHSNDLLKGYGIRSFIAVFRRGKGDAEKLSDEAKATFLKQRSEPMLLLIRTFQWLLVNLKKKCKHFPMAGQALPDPVPSLSSQSNLLSVSPSLETLQLPGFPLSSSDSTTKLFPTSWPLHKFFPLTGIVFPTDLFVFVFVVFGRASTFSAFKTGLKYHHFRDGLHWPHYLNNIFMLSSISMLLFFFRAFMS